jgi:hypothetical protein
MSQQHTISANSLFHFTKRLDNLLGILKNEFIPKYREEEFTFSKVRDKYSLFVPMVCFCDLPLSQIKNHVSEYGEYGVGLSKEWGVSNGLNPVIYLQKGTVISDAITEIGNFIFKHKNTIADVTTDISASTNMLRAFIKPYELEDVFDGTTIRYYDESEWRYVPKLPVFAAINPSKAIKVLNNAIAIDKSVRLRFEPEDVKYIIVKKEDERLEMIHSIQSIKSKYTEDQRLILISKIFVTNDIMSDV